MQCSNKIQFFFWPELTLFLWSLVNRYENGWAECAASLDGSLYEEWGKTFFSVSLVLELKFSQRGLRTSGDLIQFNSRRRRRGELDTAAPEPPGPLPAAEALPAPELQGSGLHAGPRNLPGGWK